MQKDLNVMTTKTVSTLNTVSLNTLLPGERGKIRRINHASPRIRQRLLEMGLVNGTQIQLVRFAPMGDPIEVQVRSYRLSLRKLEAEVVMVEKEAQ
jgi:Fe2+ transport system protein FeoA